VIVVLSRPTEDLAWWFDLCAEFADARRRAERTGHHQQAPAVLHKSAAAITHTAAPRRSGNLPGLTAEEGDLELPVRGWPLPCTLRRRRGTTVHDSTNPEDPVLCSLLRNGHLRAWPRVGHRILVLLCTLLPAPSVQRRNEDDADMCAAPTILEPPRGLALSAFHIICPGLHRVIRFPRPVDRATRQSIERSIGQRIFQAGSFGYAAEDVTVEGAESVDVECDSDRQLHLFDLRNCIRDQASREKLQARFGFGGEIQITGLAGDVEIDGLRVERRLRLRVSESDIPERQTWIVGRHDTRYLVAGTLADRQVRERAVGETAERLSGDGPTRGEVVNTPGREITLAAKNGNTTVEPSDYTLTVRSSYVTRYHNANTLKRLQIASGSLTATGQRNRYAVKDRYKALAEDMEQFGWAITMPGNREAVIERAWTEIRIQGGGA